MQSVSTLKDHWELRERNSVVPVTWSVSYEAALKFSDKWPTPLTIVAPFKLTYNQ